MKQLFTFLITLLSISFGFTQQSTLEDFESSPTIQSFEGLGSASLVADPATGGTNGDTFKLVTSSGGNGWQGAQVDLASGNYADLTSDKTMKIDVYSTVAFSLMAKVEDKVNNPAAPAAANTQAHNGTGWETLTFTFTTGSDNSATANGTYTRVALFPNRKADDSGWNSPIAAVTMYADNITAVKYVATGPTCSDGIMNGDETGIDCGGTSCSPCPVPPTTAPTAPPARAAADVLSIYGEAYGTAVGLTNVAWDNADFAEETIAGNKVLKVDLGSSAFFGASLNTQPTDASVMTHFHVDYWVADAFVTGQTLNAKWSNHAGGSGETSAFSKTDVLVAADVQTWKSMDVEISTLTNTTRNELWEFIVTAANSTGSASLIYIDNVYFHNNVTLAVNDIEDEAFSVYPNPINDIIEIRAAQAVHHVRIHDLTGKEVLRAAPNQAHFTLNTSALGKGVYLLSVVSDGNESTAKLVK